MKILSLSIITTYQSSAFINKTFFSHFTYCTYMNYIYADTVSAMAFGKLGQEDHVLILVTNGNLNFFSANLM